MKKIGFLTLLMTATLLFTLAFPASAAGPKAPAASPAASAPAVPAATPAPHPAIAASLEAMRSARAHLAEADHDFHGHRLKAIEHLDQAIHEAEICMQEP